MSVGKGHRLPLTVLAGFLGSGKTTQVNRLLSRADGPRIMVLVNDFGAIGIDAELIAARGADTISLANGCVCCAIGGDLFAAFARALDVEPRPDHLLIEASGVADPGRIADFARAEPDMRLDQIVVLVDALNVGTTHRDPLLHRTLVNQIAAAHTLVLTKTDLVPAAGLPGLEALLRGMNADAPLVVPARDDDLSALLLGPFDRAQPVGAPPHPASRSLQHHDHFDAWSFAAETALSARQIERIVAALPPALLRMKGICYQAGEEHYFAFHVAGRHRDTGWAPAPADMAPGLRVVAIAAKDTCDFTRIERVFSASPPSRQGAPGDNDLLGADSCDHA